jgi:hypothetical protein
LFLNFGQLWKNDIEKLIRPLLEMGIQVALPAGCGYLGVAFRHHQYSR